MKFLNQIIPVSESLRLFLLENIKVHALKRGNLLLQPGQVSDKIYFIEAGLIRAFYIKDGKDITTGFMKESDFALSPISFFWTARAI